MSTVPILIAENDRRNIVIDRPAIVVGRSRRRSDVRINDQSISAVHCEISIGENCLKVRNRGRNGIRINGRKSDDGILMDGDTLEIARLKYRVLMKGDSKQSNALPVSRSNDWLVRLAGIELGPMPWSELSLMAQRGELTQSDEVRWSGQQSWRPAAAAEGLFDSDETSATTVGRSESENRQPAPPIESLTPPEKSLETSSLNDDLDDPSWTMDFESSDDAANALDSAAESLADTTTGRLDETDESAGTFKLDYPLKPATNAASADSAIMGKQGDVDLTWQLADALEEEQDGLIEPPPVPARLKMSPPPVPVTPSFTPTVGRSDALLDRIHDVVLAPVLDRVPILRAWPTVAALAAGIVLVIFLMRPAYEGSFVSGKVTLQGQPLSHATITFTDVKFGFGASAVIGQDGTFEVVTLKGGMRPGTYSIAIMPMKPESPEIVRELQRQYSESRNGESPDEAIMLVEGEGGPKPDRATRDAASDAITLPATTIPFHYRSIQTSGLTREITEDGPNELLIELTANPG